MVKLYSVREMQALEQEANEVGLTYEKMMENAGIGIAKEIESAYSHLPNKNIVALVGSGNNGGDALVALDNLSQKKWQTCAYIVKKRDVNDPLVIQLINHGGQIINFDNDKKLSKLGNLIDKSSILLDGVFGTGIKLPLKEDVSKVLSFVKHSIETNTEKIHVIAVDCPSGVDSETGEVDEATIPAELTVTMAGIKNGLIKFPAAALTGELRVASIGSIEDLQVYQKNNKMILTRETVRAILPDRPPNAHKGTFGTALIIAGSVNYTGAALLAGLAAYRSGAGLVTMGIPVPLHEALSGQFPESTWVLLPHEMGVISADAVRIVMQNLERATAILIGPGFGLEETTREFLFKLFSIGSGSKTDIGFIHPEVAKGGSENIDKPIILDADGLKLMSKINNWPKLIPSPAVLTPHPGEMSILTGLSTEEIQDNRIEVAAKYAVKWEHVVVLKGAFTVIAAPDGHIAVVPVASAALARAGTGDVLAGLIVGLRAQGVGAFESACAGAWIHATAGILAAKQLGNTASILASDVLNNISQVISYLLSP